MTEKQTNNPIPAPSQPALATQANDTAAVPDAATSAAPEPLVKAKPKRTFGLWAVDVLIYPFVTHFAVFAVSVWASYVSNFREKVDVNPNDNFLKRAHTSIANGMKDRTVKYYDRPLEKLGFNPQSEGAKTAKMVLFSFVDGCFVAPFTKLLEDRREVMAKRIDTVLGIKPDDESVYTAEPKQTWGSVLLGRAKTAAIIVPIAAALEKFSVTSAPRGFNVRIVQEGDGLKNLNASFLGAFGRWMKNKVMDPLARFSPSIDKFQKNLVTSDGNDPGGKFSYTLAFETFYTAVCTFCLYAFSRKIARNSDKKHAQEDAAAARYAANHATTEATHEVTATPEVEKPSVTARNAAPVERENHSTTEQVVDAAIRKLSSKAPAQAGWQNRLQESAAEAQLAGFAKA